MAWLFTRKKKEKEIKKTEKEKDKQYLHILQQGKLPVVIPLKNIPDISRSSNVVNFFCDMDQECISYDKRGGGYYLWSLSTETSGSAAILQNVDIIFPAKITKKCEVCDSSNSKEAVITAKTDKLIIKYRKKRYCPSVSFNQPILEEKYQNNIDRIEGLTACINFWEEAK